MYTAMSVLGPNGEGLPVCLGLHGNCKCSAMFWGCITYQGVRTSTEVEGNINSRKYINILDTYLWPGIARHFPRCLFSVRMVRVLQIFLLLNSWNCNRLRTVLEEIVFGKTLFTLFVISVKLCRLSCFLKIISGVDICLCFPAIVSCYYIFVRGWSKPALNCRNIRSKSIRCVKIFEAIR
jgi:hypothetical protein